MPGTRGARSLLPGAPPGGSPERNTGQAAQHFGSTTSAGVASTRTVFRDSPVRRDTSRSDITLRKCIRLILANIPTMITPRSPARSSSG